MPNNLAMVVNAPGEIGTRKSEVRKREGSAVLPQYGVKELEKENSRLRRLVTELSLEKQVLKDVASGNF